MRRTTTPSTLLACALLATGCHALIDADAHSHDYDPDSGTRSDTSVADSGHTMDTGTDGGTDAGPACAMTPGICGPRILTGCGSTGCRTCPARTIDATPWLEAAADEPLAMAAPMFDVKIANGGGGAFWGWVAYAIGPLGSQIPRLAAVPMSTTATRGVPAPMSLGSTLAGWQDTSQIALDSGMTSELIVFGRADGNPVSHILRYGFESGAIFVDTSIPSSPMGDPTGGIASVTVPLGGPGTMSVFVWPNLPPTGTPRTLRWVDEHSDWGDFALPQPEFTDGAFLRGSWDRFALVQSRSSLQQAYVYGPPSESGTERFDFVRLEARGQAGWMHLRDGTYLAAAPRGNSVSIIEVNTDACSPNCAASFMVSIDYDGAVISARVVELDQAIGLATIIQRGGQREVELRLLAATDYAVMPNVAPIDGASTDDWLWAPSGPETSELVLAPSPRLSTDALYVGVAWADAAGGDARLKARFVAFDGCGME